MFYTQLLPAQIPKAPKNSQDVFFALLGSERVNAACTVKQQCSTWQINMAIRHILRI